MIANIASDDALILPHHANPARSNFQEQQRILRKTSEAVTAAPDLRNWLLSLAAFARRAVDRHVGIVFVIS